MDLQLQGKRVLVTAATGGIGLATARMMAAEGAMVVINGRNSDKVADAIGAIRRNGGEAEGAVVDLSTVAAVDTLLACVGPIDILVNNFGGRVDDKPYQWFDVPLADWAQSYERNALVAIALCRGLAKDMVARGWGRIINISTMAATEPNETSPEYQAAKAALNNVTKSLSKALAGSGVTVNGVAPGMVMTEMLQSWITMLASRDGWDGDFTAWEQRYASEIRPICSPRIARPDDLAFMIATLASPLSHYVNGAVIHVDGGATRAV